MKDIILIDIDHTISDAAWRDGLIGGEGGWDAYHIEAAKDEPLADIVRLVRILRLGERSSEAHIDLIGLTSRPYKWRMMTLRWLLNNGILLDDVWFRPDDCYLKSPECKIGIVEKQLGTNWPERIMLLFDDRDDVAEAFHRCGVTTLQVRGRRHERAEETTTVRDETLTRERTAV